MGDVRKRMRSGPKLDGLTERTLEKYRRAQAGSGLYDAAWVRRACYAILSVHDKDGDESEVIQGSGLCEIVFINEGSAEVIYRGKLASGNRRIAFEEPRDMDPEAFCYTVDGKREGCPSNEETIDFLFNVRPGAHAVTPRNENVSMRDRPYDCNMTCERRSECTKQKVSRKYKRKRLVCKFRAKQ